MAPALGEGEVACSALHEPWRWALAPGSAVGVWSANAGRWLPSAAVVEANAQRVRVAYDADGERLYKVMLRTAPGLRPTAAPQPAPALAAELPAARGQRRWSDPVPGGPQRVAGAAAPAALAAAPAATPAATHHCGEASERRLVLAPGEFLEAGDLEVGELLGSGGFGAVHRGRLRGEEVAVKRLHLAGGSLSSRQLTEFRKEVANLQALRHPRLIRFIGVALEPPATFSIVTELAAGGSLHGALHEARGAGPDGPTRPAAPLGAPLGAARRRTLALQVVEGVAFLHGRQPPMVHRDLKSANVVLNNDLDAKLCDFGLSESMEKTHISRHETEAGSPRYMAPEVFDARSKLTEKLDIWALGCLLVEIVTSRIPHEECANLQQVAAKLLVRRQGPFEDDWADGLRPELRRLADQCFEREAASRPSAAAVLDGLSQLPAFAA